jgi:hypothetical protein
MRSEVCWKLVNSDEDEAHHLTTHQCLFGAFRPNAVAHLVMSRRRPAVPSS